MTNDGTDRLANAGRYALPARRTTVILRPRFDERRQPLAPESGDADRVVHSDPRRR